MLCPSPLQLSATHRVPMVLVSVWPTTHAAVLLGTLGTRALNKVNYTAHVLYVYQLAFMYHVPCTSVQVLVGMYNICTAHWHTNSTDLFRLPALCSQCLSERWDVHSECGLGDMWLPRGIRWEAVPDRWHTQHTHCVHIAWMYVALFKGKMKTSAAYVTCTKGSIVFTSYREYRIFWDSWHWYIIECKLQQSTYCNLVNDQCSLIQSVHGTYVHVM